MAPWFVKYNIAPVFGYLNKINFLHPWEMCPGVPARHPSLRMVSIPGIGPASACAPAAIHERWCVQARIPHHAAVPSGSRPR
jgi:hypothetical protein